ncbi:hypothetical protein I540_6082 [Mycobacteroides abscessus subsp. bolletii 1513]|uniref:Uncharacterized protein n=1 Tax=Mycobacteroides abscessus subsp. bolletii 1513 TaxID=1299321 RepID=X8DDP5_9MYCO|nr:hypothetical protein I540_6082 [Mycobacteroides abscessus subsp. bolletii 1513]
MTAAAIVAIAIVALAAIIGRLYEEQRIEEQSSREALAAAQEFANVMINVDSAKLDESSNKTLERSTGDFKQKYSESSTTLRQVMIEKQGQSHGRCCGFCGEVGDTGQVEEGVAVHRSGSIQRGDSRRAHGPKPGADNDAEGRRPLACQRC